MRNVVQQSFVVFTIGEKSYTVIYQKYMKENVVSSEISIQNKAEMSFQMKRHRTYFRTRSFQCNKLKKKFLFKQERDSYSSFNRASFVTFVTAKVTI